MAVTVLKVFRNCSILGLHCLHVHYETLQTHETDNSCKCLPYQTCCYFSYNDESNANGRLPGCGHCQISIVLSKSFIHQLMHKRIALKRILKFTLKQLLHVLVQSPSSGSILFELTKVTTVSLVSSNNTLPDDGDCTKTCRSCFNVNFNLSCISW